MIQCNPLLITYLAVFVFKSAFQVALDLVNIFYLRRHKGRVPQAFQGKVDEKKFSDIAAYTTDTGRVGIFSRLFEQALLILVLLTGFLPWLVHYISRWDMGIVVSGLLFFAMLGLIFNLLDIPFDLYDTFVIEEKYGFNLRTLKLWIADWIKGLALSFVLGGILVFLVLELIIHFSQTWWIWAWIVISAFEFLIMWLYPVFIAPIFNKFEPIPDKELEDRIAETMKKAGLAVKGVFQMDAGRRSTHTNAYFTGLGKTKRVVLFDTLLKKHPEQEILSVLAHEAGHWIKKHITKQIVLMEVFSLIGVFILAKMLDWPLLYSTFGFEGKVVYAGLFLVAAVLSPVPYFLSPAATALSRKFEKEADDFSVELTGKAGPMKDALIRLSSDNLANLMPHPFYSWFYYSHSSPVERIERLERKKP